MASRHDWPCFASGLDFVRPRQDGIPNGVMLPTYLNNGYGFSGQDGGVLGAKYDPWHIKQDPNLANFRVENLSLPFGLSVTDLDNRNRLLASIERQEDDAGNVSPGDGVPGTSRTGDDHIDREPTESRLLY